MDRTEQIRQEGNQLMEPVLRSSMVQLLAAYKQNEEEYMQVFQNLLQDLFAKAEKMQKCGQKGPVCYLGICYCLSSIYTQNYELKLDLYDKEFYLDEAECSVYWKPLFITSYLEQDIDYFEKNIKRRIPRIRTYEIQQYIAEYFNNYIYIISEFLRQKLPEIMKKILISDIETGGELQVFFGEYMGIFSMMYRGN